MGSKGCNWCVMWVVELGECVIFSTLMCDVVFQYSLK